MITAAAFCAVTVTQIAVVPGLTAQYRIRPINCAPGQTARTRKRNLTNYNAPYKPIFPLTGAWVVPAGGYRDEWVGNRWQIEYYAGKAGGVEIWKRAIYR